MAATHIIGDKLTQTVKDFNQRSRLVSIQKPTTQEQVKRNSFLAEKVHEARVGVISTFDAFSG